MQLMLWETCIAWKIKSLIKQFYVNTMETGYNLLNGPLSTDKVVLNNIKWKFVTYFYPQSGPINDFDHKIHCNDKFTCKLYPEHNFCDIETVLGSKQGYKT